MRSVQLRRTSPSCRRCARSAEARLLAVHAFKLAAVLSAPEAMVAYFVSGQIQLGADLAVEMGW